MKSSYFKLPSCKQHYRNPNSNEYIYIHIRALRHIRSYLTKEAAKTIASAIVESRLDYYFNTLLAGSSVSNLACLQLVQNTLARVVAQKSCFDHITPVLSELHWLPVCHRINFKISTITHRLLQSQQPSYLAVLISRYAPVRSLWSSSSLSIGAPLRKTSMATSRSFSTVAPKIWNSLPTHLSSTPTLPAFRRHHIFLRAFPGSRTPGGITPSERITLCDTAPPAITPLGNIPSSYKRVTSERLRLAEVI